MLLHSSTLHGIYIIIHLKNLFVASKCALIVYCAYYICIYIYIACWYKLLCLYDVFMWYIHGARLFYVHPFSFQFSTTGWKWLSNAAADIQYVAL